MTGSEGGNLPATFPEKFFPSNLLLGNYFFFGFGLPELTRWKRNIKQVYILKFSMNFVNCGMNTFISNYCFKKVSFHIFVFIFEKIDQTFIDIILIFLHIFKSYPNKR